ncbi:MAG: type I restriction enzyme HsdR N-terminal domain-containing protein [Bacteroidota bacterium]|nr:type I restriction enzyme HsdR N-terminal domain-containing protein [Bacteroidota bacterium]
METRIKQKEMNGKIHLYSILRKKYLIKTPEETVRQCFVNFLIEKKEYPKSLMKEECNVPINGMQKRADLVVYKPNLTPIFLAEFKSPKVKLDHTTAFQIARYNFVLQVPVLVVSNLSQTYVFERKNGHYQALQHIPAYNKLHL